METATKTLFDFEAAYDRLKDVVKRTPLEYNAGLSAKYECDIYLKREDLQIVRSYKIRGAYNKISQLDAAQMAKGVVCASAGNHAQGVALSCKLLGINGVIFMPEITPKQKVKQTEMHGKGNIEIVLTGDTFDDCLHEALAYTEAHEMTFVPPFDDYRTIEGQGTVGVEIYQDLLDLDMIIMPIGGGGLAAGTGTYLKQKKTAITLIGVEPEGAPSMLTSIKNGENTTLANIDRFVDGAAVKRVGDKTFAICREILDEVLTVPEGKVCTTILKLYNEDAIVVEPAGALSVTVLDNIKEQIKGKKVVCIISGGNNDIDRMQEIKERSLLYEGLKHYFIITFPQRPGALKLFVNNVLGPADDITRFEFIKKTERESGPALVGIELKSADDYPGLLKRMEAHRFGVKILNEDPTLFGYLV
jgi:threonine dehydratase